MMTTLSAIYATLGCLSIIMRLYTNIFIQFRLVMSLINLFFAITLINYALGEYNGSELIVNFAICYVLFHLSFTMLFLNDRAKE